MSQDTDRIEKRVTLEAPREQVWRAISDARQCGTWFGMRLDGQFVAGERITGRISPTQVDSEVARMQEACDGAPGDLLVISSDGVFEAANESGATFGWAGFRAAVAAGEAAPEATIERIREALSRHVRGGELSDDYTLVAIRRDPAS